MIHSSLCALLARSIPAANNLCDHAPRLNFGQNRSCFSAARDAGQHIVLDALMTALDDELEAADVAEVGSAALGVRPRARTDQCRE
jgi:hypothetical protein